MYELLIHLQLFYTHEPYILYTPYHTIHIETGSGFFPKTQIRI